MRYKFFVSSRICDITWQRFPHYWSFVREIHWSLVDAPDNEPVMRSLLFSLLLAWTICWPWTVDLLVIWDVMSSCVWCLLQVCLITYRDNSETQFSLNTYNTRQQIMDALVFQRDEGSTNTRAALNTLNNNLQDRNRGNRRDVMNVVIILTDGCPDLREDDFRFAQRMRNGTDTDPSLFFVVGVGDHLNRANLNQLSSFPNDPYYQEVRDIDSTWQVENAVTKIVQAVCNRPWGK